MPLFSPLKDRFDTLPLILCGPIVRRVETELVTVWVALKEPRKISLELYTGYCSPPDATFTGKTVAFTSTPTDTIAVGSNLHIGLVTIDTQGLLTPGGIVSYNLLFSGTSVADSNLISLGLLNEPVVLGFKAGQLPSFQVAPLKLEDLRIAHGSCRKPHGEGRDGLAILAKVMEADFTDPARANDSQVRPHCLFHTGDQIYADDVSAFLAPLLNDAGIQLLGIIESLPLPRLTTEKPDKKFPVLKPDLSNLAEEVSWIDATAEKWPMMRRATNYYSGFSGDEANHLTAFGEFCAAYLFQWSNVLWPDALPDPGALFDARLSQSTSSSALYLKPFFPKPANFDQLAAEDKKKYTDSVAEARKTFVAKAARPGSDRHSVLEFKAGLVLVRRALANVPSIMIFDDHDVTDDWYLTGGWSKRALGNPFGRTIIRNALAAFALFQGSGNDPKLYQKADSPQAQLIASFKTLLGKYRKSTASPSEITPEQGKQILTDADKIDQLLGFNDFTSPPVKWHCSFRLGATKVYGLDTRTRRDFSDGLNFPPNLIGPQALAEQLPDTVLPAGIELAVIISAAPVLGLATMEAIGQPIVSRVLDAVHMGKEGTENKERDVPIKGMKVWILKPGRLIKRGSKLF
ncbi:hypothetical protein GO730_32830 [Spirosoma sp. HMF3257]|uniref:Uncharacterized protein n=1 Tax=Spirosoma telluris TaxID=2183553 RepID=A0A327NSK6_9BACT|nr:hypothetical protein [Spirosoma telluris]RAI77715.1 hypothetical protein HMF3257_32735 [Spirosoma telluris]